MASNEGEIYHVSLFQSDLEAELQHLSVALRIASRMAAIDSSLKLVEVKNVALQYDLIESLWNNRKRAVDQIELVLFLLNF